jgi:hypothetical protein
VAQVQSLRRWGKVGFVGVRDAPQFVMLNAPACFQLAASQLLDGALPADERCGPDAEAVPR